MSEVPVTRVAPDHVPVPGPLPSIHLADSTVWSKVRPYPALVEWFNAEVRSDRIVTCDVVALEVLRSARSSDAFTAQSRMLSLLRQCVVAAPEWRSAREVQQLLASRGRHRGVPPADLLIAAAAESAHVSVLHYDHDFDLIAGVSGQPTRWLLPAGALP